MYFGVNLCGSRLLAVLAECVREQRSARPRMGHLERVMPDGNERGGWLQLAPALFIAFATVAAGVVAYHAPPESGEMGVVFAPWTSEAEALGAVVAAGGRLVNSSRLPNVLIAYAFDDAFEARVRERGAWFTVAARGLCGPAAQGEVI